jgi:hypothetical protein
MASGYPSIPQAQNSADVIRQHRDEHARDSLIGDGQGALATGDIASDLQLYLRQAT